ncbi:MAG: alpha/beta hydrolase [Acidimicrobiia bacterium]
MDFLSDEASREVRERRFDLKVEDRVVPGIVWTPENASGPRPLVLLGHGGSQHKRVPNILSLARRLVRHLGYAAAAIDGPMHGDRVEGGHELTLTAVRDDLAGLSDEERRTLFRNMRADWSATIDALRELDEIGEGPTGYWGLSMGTVIGLPFVASEPRIDAAVLGLMGVEPGAKPRSATTLEIPVLFIVQWHDELVARERALALFDAIASKNKRMHVNPGAHSAVPAEEIQASEDFFEKYLGAKVPAKA